MTALPYPKTNPLSPAYYGALIFSQEGAPFHLSPNDRAEYLEKRRVMYEKAYRASNKLWNAHCSQNINQWGVLSNLVPADLAPDPRGDDPIHISGHCGAVTPSDSNIFYVSPYPSIPSDARFAVRNHIGMKSPSDVSDARTSRWDGSATPLSLTFVGNTLRLAQDEYITKMLRESASSVAQPEKSTITTAPIPEWIIRAESMKTNPPKKEKKMSFFSKPKNPLDMPLPGDPYGNSVGRHLSAKDSQIKDLERQALQAQLSSERQIMDQKLQSNQAHSQATIYKEKLDFVVRCHDEAQRANLVAQSEIFKLRKQLEDKNKPYIDEYEEAVDVLQARIRSLESLTEQWKAKALSFDAMPKRKR